MTGSTASQWLLAAPGMLLALLALIVVVRALVDLLAGTGGGVIRRALTVISDPVLAPVRAITPRIVPPPLVALLAVSWLVALRMLLLFIAAALGLRTSFSG